jgi:hypothetical protein
MGIESTIPVLQRAKRVHALDRVATVTGNLKMLHNIDSVTCFNANAYLLIQLKIAIFQCWHTEVYILEETSRFFHAKKIRW